MKQILLAVGVSCACSAGVLAANDNVRVTISGCVMDGEHGSFILSNVQEMSGGTMTPTSTIYWLSTTKGLKENVGQRVEVAGTYSPSRDKGKTGKMSVTTDSATGQETIEVENGAKKAEATTENSVAGTSGVKTEIKRPYRRLEVKSLKASGERCAP